MNIRKIVEWQRMYVLPNGKKIIHLKNQFELMRPIFNLIIFFAIFLAVSCMPTLSELEKKKRLPEPFGRDTEQILIVGLHPVIMHGLFTDQSVINRNKTIKELAEQVYHGKMEFLSQEIYDSLIYVENDSRRFVVDYYLFKRDQAPNPSGGSISTITVFQFFILDRKTKAKYACDQVTHKFEKYATAYFNCIEECRVARSMPK